MQTVGLSLAVFSMGIAAAQSKSAPTYTILYTFQGTTDGGEPLGNLILDSAGDLYGTTSLGGDLSCVYDSFTPGCGTVFKVNPSGIETVLHSFTGGTDGIEPTGSLILTGGNLYGVSQSGGLGFGTVFKVNGAGQETVLYRFTGDPDGAYPSSGLVRDASGNLYGTTSAGGAFNYGAIFKIGATGKEIVLYSFTGGADGGYPYAKLIRDSSGNLYGTTEAGGNVSTCNCGVVFKLDITGKETVLYSFAEYPDGSNPLAGLIRDSIGNFYGTTNGGGAYNGGTAFKLDPTDKETVLYSFSFAGGGGPDAVLIPGPPGGVYGTTSGAGGASFGDPGTVFKLNLSGQEVVLHTFLNGPPDGWQPLGLVRDAIGNLYGATSFGGISNTCSAGSHVYGCGIVFKLTP